MKILSWADLFQTAFQNFEENFNFSSFNICVDHK